MHIGLIGGIGPAATDYYYRRLISKFAALGRPLDLSIVHADAPTLLGNLESGAEAAQVAIYDRLTARLVSAGAECVVVTSIAGHFCIDAFESGSPLPVINMLTAVDEAVTGRGLSRVGILGTRTVMESRFYGGVRSAEVIPPDGNALAEVHSAYVEMAMSGEARDEQRAVFDAACTTLIDEAGVEAVMLGGTDLALVYPEGETRFPLVDCAAIHADAVVQRAVG